MALVQHIYVHERRVSITTRFITPSPLINGVSFFGQMDRYGVTMVQNLCSRLNRNILYFVGRRKLLIFLPCHLYVIYVLNLTV